MFREIPGHAHIEGVIDELQDEYSQNHDKPWIIGFSGGKDSTVLLTLTWIAIRRLKDSGIALNRQVFVVCNDTLVENPIITKYTQIVLKDIQVAALEQQLPIQVVQTTPELYESFWTNVIGKGYPVPNNTFRWCTDRLKIKPTASFLERQVSDKGEAIVLLGTRYAESSNRKKSMKKHERKGHRLAKHATSPGTMVYAPIKDLETEDIWFVIQGVKSPWNFDNKILFDIYMDASADDYECPTVVTNKSHRSCGQSRFGCWTCTVVKEDKSMRAMIESKYSWLSPLLELRNQLQDERNISKNRSSTRRNGMPAVSEEGDNFGNYTFDYRVSVLTRLLRIQRDLKKAGHVIELITSQELSAIQISWDRDGFTSPRVTDISNQINGSFFEDNLSTEIDHVLDEVSSTLIPQLLTIHQNKSLMIKKIGLVNDVEKALDKFLK